MNKLIYSFFALILFFLEGLSFGQEEIIISGKITNKFTKKKLDFATIAIPSLKLKTKIDQDGQYSLLIPQTGTYWFYISSAGFVTLEDQISISGSLIKNYELVPLSLKGQTLVITGERDRQKISRRTMTVEDLKETPASLGDSINALTSLPGIERTDGFFGPLVIRGADLIRNKYFIDGLPIMRPMHFIGLHSVIANDLMSEIDLYASSFPAKYGQALAAVIEINTLDEVKDFGGVVDVGLISGSTFLKFPLLKDVWAEGERQEKQCGYVMAAGRVGYLSLVIPFFYETFLNQELSSIPQYYDYQLKFKYYLNSHNSVRFLFLGAKDYWKLLLEDLAEINVEEGDDPLMQNLVFKDDSSFHNLGGYYTYQNDKLKNEVMFFVSLNKNYTYADGGEGVAETLQDFYTDSNPNIFGAKDSFELEWWSDFAKLRGAFEFNYYYFKADGWSLLENGNYGDEGEIDLADENAFYKEELDIKGNNKTLGGYLDNKFTWNNFTLVPGVRADYLARTKKTTIDPRGMVSYTFPSQTTLSWAGGRYSYFFQTNPFLFNLNPDVCFIGKGLKPERAWHNAMGIEQKYALYTLGLEAFYNYFYDLSVAYPHIGNEGDFVLGCSEGENKAYGFEVLLRKDKEENQNDFFGWLSYTYTQSKYKNGVTGPLYDLNQNSIPDTEFDPYSDSWRRMSLEREHTLKLVFGYNYQAHTWSGRWQLYSSFPYTKVVGYEKSPEEDLETGPRYVPIYSEEKNTEHFPNQHRLDFRYSYQSNYQWGHVKFYFEIINVYGFWYHPKNELKWKYNEIYQAGENPKVESDSEGLNLIPNFGVEIKF